MLTKIIQFSIKNKLIIGLFIIGLIGYGVYEVKKLPIDAVPDITNNQVQIITISPALGANDVERLITFPIEQENSNIPGLKELRSISRFGLSVVTLVFNDNVDVYWARQQIAERLIHVQNLIPQGVGTPSLAPVTTGLGEIYQYTVRAKKGYENKYNSMDLRTIQDWIIRKQLLGVQGVAEVSSFGGLLKQYEVAVEPSKLMAYNITINDVFSALEKNNQNVGGSYIEKGPTALYIKTEGLVEDFDDIKNIVVKKLSNGTPLLIRDVADVKLGNATRYGAMTFNGTTQVSGAVVMMLKGANSNEVIKNIKERIAQIQKTLPEGVIIDPFIDRTKMVNNAISTVSKNLAEGALIVVFVLVLFLGNFRAGFLVASIIPLSMLFAIILMNLFGVSGNLMSLGALDFGLIVDGAVIIVEAVMHQLSKRKEFAQLNKLSQIEMDSEVKKSATKMMNSAVFGQIIILMVYLPIFSLQGIEGKMFKPMAQTVAFALAGAFILSLTYIPMMSSLVLSKKLKHKVTFSDKMMYRLEKVYQRNLIKTLNHKKKVLASVVVLFAFAIFLLTRLGGEFIPSLPEGDFAVDTRVLSGSNLNTSIEAASKASKILLEKFPEVKKVVTRTGISEVPTDPMPVEASDMMIILKDRKNWTSAKTYEELESKMSKSLEDIPGVSFGFQYPVAMRFNELISGSRQDVVCKIYGENLDTLAAYAEHLGNICKTVEGSTGLYVEAVTGMPQIIIKYNRTAIAQYGLNISDVNNVINAAFAGKSSGLVYEGEKRFDLVVRLSGKQRKEVDDVNNLLITTPKGTQIPLQHLAEVKIEDGYSQIQRENFQRRIMVGFNVRGRDVQSIVNELQEKVEHQIKLSPGYFIAYGGAFENLNAAKQRLFIAVPVSLLLIFLLLYFAFNSIKQSLLIYTAIPLSAIGGIMALSIRDIPFSISAGVGFIALFGVAVLNGIVLIAEFNALKKEGLNDIKHIVITGTKTRLRPVLMTALVASLGFLPMAISHGEGAEVQRPLATVVIGGLLVATLLTLFVLPILYIMFNRKIFIPKKTISATSVIVVMLMASLFQANAQKPILLKNATDTALKNNLLVKNERLRSDYQKLLIQTNKNIAHTNFTTEFGQINSAYVDIKFGVAQTINFPKVYASQKALLTAEWKNSLLNVSIKESSLKKQVAQVFYNLLYLQEKKKLLESTDTVFAEFLRKSTLRFNTGESNLLEKTTAENQRGQIALQLAEIKQDIEILQKQFQLLLNTETVLMPDENDKELKIFSITDSSLLTTHPAIQLYKQEQETATALTQVEKNKLLPELTLGYNIMGMKGSGSDNKTYNSVPRFHSVQIGLGISIFNNSQKAKINAAKLNEEIVQHEYELNLKTFENNFKIALTQYQKFSTAVQYYKTVALKNAETITLTANKQFVNGDINYLEWVILMNQVVTIHNNYIDALFNKNNAATELNYFYNK